MPPPAKVLARANVTAMKLEAFKYYYIPSGDTGLAGICREADPGIAQAAGGPDCGRGPVHGGNRRLGRVRHHAR